MISFFIVRVNTVVDMLELDQVKRNGSMENRLVFLEEQVIYFDIVSQHFYTVSEQEHKMQFKK